MRIPNRLYELLPLLYGAFGLLVAVRVDNLLGRISGLLLMVAGLAIWHMRRMNRPTQDAPQRPRREREAPARQTGLVQLVWKKDYECGIEAIDSQHRRLFNLGNLLLNAIIEKKSKLDVELMLDDLLKEVTDHFCTEESLLARARHPLSPHHRAIHHELLARCQRLAADYHDDRVMAGELFHFVAVEVISTHIVDEDLKFLAARQGTA